MRKIKVFGIALAMALLTCCNMPGKLNSPTGLDVTQAYQTIQAQLTQTLAQGTTPTSSSDPENPTVTNAELSSQDTPEPSQTSSPHALCDQAAAAYPKIDITVEDDTEMEPGERFTKIWRVVNAGTCTWTPDYEIVFFSGVQMGGASSQPLNTYVGPNQSVDLSLEMIAPDVAGTYQSNWKLRNADGLLFGIGPSGGSPFWVRIKVVQIATVTPTLTPTPTSSPTSTPTVAVQVDGVVTLLIGDTLDLDNLLINAGGVDLIYTKTVSTPPQHQLVPTANLSLGFYGGLMPDLMDCQAASIADTPILLNELAIGSFLCYQTDLGLFGWIRLDKFDPNVGEVKLHILTWESP